MCWKKGTGDRGKKRVRRKAHVKAEEKRWFRRKAHVNAEEKRWFRRKAHVNAEGTELVEERHRWMQREKDGKKKGTGSCRLN